MADGPDTVAEPGTASGARAAAGSDMATGSGVTPGPGVARRGLDAVRRSPDLVIGADRTWHGAARTSSAAARTSYGADRGDPEVHQRCGPRNTPGRARGAAGRLWLAGEVLALAPRLPVRDQAALRAQFPGKSPDELADALIEGASRASSAVGATVGIWSVLPVAPAFPAEIVTETLTLVGIEIKLIAELRGVRHAAAR